MIGNKRLERKKVSDTPRTDAEIFSQQLNFGPQLVKADFARQLERELTALRLYTVNACMEICKRLSESYEISEWIDGSAAADNCANAIARELLR